MLWRSEGRPTPSIRRPACDYPPHSIADNANVVLGTLPSSGALAAAETDALVDQKQPATAQQRTFLNLRGKFSKPIDKRAPQHWCDDSYSTLVPSETSTLVSEVIAVGTEDINTVIRTSLILTPTLLQP